MILFIQGGQFSKDDDMMTYSAVFLRNSTMYIIAFFNLLKFLGSFLTILFTTVARFDVISFLFLN